jgi:uncharacterized Zn-finger protein
MANKLNYSHNAIIEWFGRAYGINHMPTKAEIKTDCPYCGHSGFYFNVAKQIGFCHRDRCHRSPTLKDLIDKKGFGPEEHGFSEPINVSEEKREIELPGDPLVFRAGEGFLTRFPDAARYLFNRNITYEDMIRFGMTFDGSRIYVPVKEEGRIVNYVGRDITGKLPLKYKYCSGQKTTNHLFGWDECMNWGYVTLVENTFVSIWLRNQINCTTNFGSHLSRKQIEMIGQSPNIQRVFIMWDEGAEGKAERAVRNLGQEGVAAQSCIMKGQPDDHPLLTLKEIIRQAWNSKEKFVDYFGRFPNKKGIIKKEGHK